MFSFLLVRLMNISYDRDPGIDSRRLFTFIKITIKQRVLAASFATPMQLLKCARSCAVWSLAHLKYSQEIVENTLCRFLACLLFLADHAKSCRQNKIESGWLCQPLPFYMYIIKVKANKNPDYIQIRDENLFNCHFPSRSPFEK